MKKFYFLITALVLIVSGSGLFGQTTYTWKGAAGADWAVPTNWTPDRTTPATTDILKFNNGGTYNIIGVITQSIRQLSVTNNTNVSFESSAVAQTLTINGLAATNNFVIDAGSTLQISSAGANQLGITYANTSGQLADISGSLIINANTAFTNSYSTAFSTTITTVATGGRIINNGGVITGAAVRLVFASGSEYQHNMDAGVVPTSSWDANSKVIIKGTFVNTPTGLNQTFGNFEVNSSTRIVSVVAGVSISGDLTITNGTLRYQTTPLGSLTVNGNLNIRASGIFDAGTGTLITHNLSLNGNLVNDGTFDMYTTAGVTTTFSGATDNSISGIGATCNFYNITVNKGTGSANIIDAQRVITQYTRTGTGTSITLTNGTLKISSASTLNPYYGTVSSFIASGGRLWINNAGATIQQIGAGTTGASSSGVGSVSGTLQIDAGTFKWGGGNNNSYVDMIASGTLSMTGGSFYTFGGLYFSTATSVFSMTAGNIYIDPQPVGGTNLIGTTHLLHFAGTGNPAVTFTGGTINILNPHSATGAGNAINISATAGTYNVAGGTIKLGDGVSTLSGSTDGFDINTTANSNNFGLCDIIIDNPASINRLVRLSGAARIVGNLNITNKPGSLLNLNGQNLYLRGTYTNNGTLTGDATNSKIILESTSSQTFDIGTYTNSKLYILEIDNSHTNGVVLGSALTVHNLIIDTDRKFNISTFDVNIKGTTSALTNNGNQIGSGKLLLSGTAVQTMSGTGFFTNLEVNNTGGVTVNANPTFNGTLTLTSTGAFNMNGAYTLAFQNANIPVARTNGTITFNANANLVFGTSGNTGGSAFTLPNGLFTANPPVIKNFSLNRVNNLSLGNQGITMSGDLTLDGGLLILGSNDLLLNNAASLVLGTPSNTSMVVVDGTGQFRKQFPAGASPAFTFPIGDNTGTAEYSPVTIEFTVNLVAGIVGARLVDGNHPNLTGAETHYLSRYFVFASTGITTYTYNLAYNYPASDIAGTQANSVYSRWDGATWSPYVSSAAANTMTVNTTLTQTTAPLSNTSSYTGREGGFTYYRSVASGFWDDPTTWETASDLAFTVPIAATVAPTYLNSTRVTIQTGHTVTMREPFGNNTVADLYVKGTGTLINSTTGNVVNFPAGGMYFDDQSTYEHARNGGTIPTAIWSATSSCKITGITTTNPSHAAIPQTFGNLIWDCPSQTSATGAITSPTTVYITNNLTVTSGTFNMSNIVYTLYGNVINNATLNTSTATMNMNGTGNQTISGTGIWTTGTAGRVYNLTINNTGVGTKVNINCTFAIQNLLNLTAGKLSGTGNLIIGIGSGTQTTYIGVSGGTEPGAVIDPALNVTYNLVGSSYNVNYYPLTPDVGYTTGKELPSGTADAPTGGTVTILNLNSTGITLANDATVFAFTINNNATLNLNGKNLRLAGNFTNSSSVVNTGLNSSVSGSKLTFIGTTGTQQNYLRNQTFAGIVTTPDVDVYNTVSGTTGGAGFWDANASIKNLTVYSLGNFYAYNGNGSLNITGNIINNGTIFDNDTHTGSYIMMSGTALQTISGTGTWQMFGTTGGLNKYTGIGINNTSGLNPSLNLNQNITLQNILYLEEGILGGTGTLTIGNAGSTMTVNVGVSGGTSKGGVIASSKSVSYNLDNTTFNANYYPLTPDASYITGKELPSVSATQPIAGTVTIVNLNADGVTLGNSATVYNFTVNNNATLNLNGKNLRIAGAFNNASSTANTGLNSSVSGSKLTFIGNAQQQNHLKNQTFAGIVTAPDVDIYNPVSGTSGGAGFWSAGGSIKNLTVYPGAYFYAYNGNGNLNVSGNIVNNGTIFADATHPTALITMNGTTIQTISGTGIWQMTGTNGGNGKYPGFGVSNTSGLNPAVTLSQNILLQNQLLLTEGILSGTGTLTIGNATGTFTCTRTDGSIASSMACAYNLNSVTYNLNYNIALTAQTTGGELPPDTYLDYKLGTMTISNPAANGGVILSRNSSINNFTTAANSKFDINGKSLSIYGSTSINASSEIDASNSNSTLLFNGIVAQTLAGTMAANYTSGYISKLTNNNPIKLTLPTITQIGSPSVNGILTLNSGELQIGNNVSGLTLYGSFAGTNGTLTSGGTTTGIMLGGTVGNMGTMNLTGGDQTIGSFIVNLGGVNPQITINGNITFNTTFTLTSGIVNMGANSVYYASNNTTPMLEANQNSTSYFKFSGNAGLKWNMSSTAAGTYRWPIGPASLSSWRPITIQTLVSAAANSSVMLGYSNPVSGTSYSASDIVSTANVRSNYIATLSLQGNIGTPNITMEYQNSDFNTVPSAATAVNLWYYNITSASSCWTATVQDVNGTNGTNTTISKTAAIPLTTAGLYPLNLGETNADPCSAVTTFVWTGTGGIQWNTPTSWSPNISAGNAPGQGTNVGVNVIIPETTSKPTITALTLSLKDVNINIGATLTLATTTSLTITGNLQNDNYNGTGNGLNNSGTSTVIYTGTSKLIAPGNYYNLTFSGATTPVLSPVGTIQVANTFTPGTAVCSYTGSNFRFVTNAQTIPAFDYFNNLEIKPGTANGAISLAGNIKVYGNLTIGHPTLSTSFNDAGFLITGPGSSSGTMSLLYSTIATGTIYNATYAGANALPIFKNYDFSNTRSTVNFSGDNLATQTIPATTYGFVNFANGTTNAKTLSGNTTFVGNIAINSGVFNDGGFICNVNGNIVNNSTIASTGAGKIVLTGATSVHALSGTSAQYGNVELNDGWGATFVSTGAVSVNGNLDITSGELACNVFTTSLTVSGTTNIGTLGTLKIGSTTGTKSFADIINNGNWNNSSNEIIDVSGTIENNNVFNSGSGVYTLSGTGKELRGTGGLTITKLTLTGTYTNKVLGTYTKSGATTYNPEKGLNIITTFAGTGTLTQDANSLLIVSCATVDPSLVASAIGNTVVYNNTAATSIKTTTGNDYYNLLLNPRGGIAYNMTGDINILNNLTFFTSNVNASFNDLTNLLTGPGPLTGTFDMSSPLNSTMNLTNTSTNPFPTFGNYDISSANTVVYNANAVQDLVNISVGTISFGSLSITAAQEKTAKQDITVKSNLTITTGSLNDGGKNITVNGNIINNGGHTGTGSIILSGGTLQHNLTGSGAYSNLTLNDTNGSLVGGAFTINGELKLTDGIFKLGNGNITTLAGTISRTNGYLSGWANSSSLTITGTGNLGTLYFETGYENINNFVMNRTGGAGELTLGTSLNIITNLNWSAANTGLIKLGNNDLIFSNTATVTTTNCSDGAMIVADKSIGTGQVKKTFPTSLTTFIFPVGEITGTVEYSPFTMTGFIALGANRTLGLNVKDANHAQLNSNQPQTNYISRYWSFTDDNAGTGYTYTGVTMTYPSADEVGTVSTTNDQVNRYDNGTTTWNTLIETTAANSTSTTAVSAVGTFDNITDVIGNSDFTIRFNPIPPYTWKGTVDSDWQKAVNWNPARNTILVTDLLQFTDGATYTVTNVPTQTIQKLSVSGNTNVTLEAATTNTLSISGSTAVNNLTVAANSTLQIGSGTNALTLSYLAAGVSGQNADISGRMVINKSGTFSCAVATTNINVSVTGEILLNDIGAYSATNTVTTVNGSFKRNAASSGTITSTAANLIFANGSFYNHATNSSSIIPTATYNNTSTVNVTGITTTNLTGMSGTFGNITWNTTGQTSTITVNGALTINGNLTVTAGNFYDNAQQITGTSTGLLTVGAGALFQMTNTASNPFPANFTTANITLNPTSTVIYAANAAQNVSEVPSTYGNLTIAGGNTRTAAGNINVAGNLIISAGTFADAGNNITVKGDVTNTVTHSGTGQLILSGGAVQHTITGTGTYGNITLNDSKGALVTNSFTISGELQLTDGIFKLGNGLTTTMSGTFSRTNGFLSGNGTNSNLTISGVGNFGTIFFETGNDSIKTFVMNKTASGELTLGTNLNISTTLTMTNGLIKLSVNDLIIGASATITGSFNDTKMIVADATIGAGKLKKVFPDGVTTTFTYPVGEISGTIEYSPIVLTGFKAVGADRTIGVNVTNDKHPQMDLNYLQSNYVLRYWSFSDDGAGTGYTYTGITTNYFGTDVVGTINTTNDKVNKYDNSLNSWSELVATTAATSTAATASGTFDNTLNRLANNDIVIRYYSGTVYTWTGAADFDWTNAGNWNPARGTISPIDIIQFNDGLTSTITKIPNQTIQKLLVSGNSDVTLQSSGNTTLTINGAVGNNNISVQTGSNLQVGSGTNTFTLTYGTTSGQKADISGTLTVNQSGTFSSGVATTEVNVAGGGKIELNGNGAYSTTNTLTTVNGSFTRKNGSSGTVTATPATLIFANGSFYNHATNSTGVIPNASFDNTSTVNVTGITTTNLSGLSGTYGNLTWNTTGQTSTTTLNGALTLNGDFNVLSGTFYDNANQITGTSTGKFKVDPGATFQMTNTAANTFPLNFTTGNITLNPAGTIVYAANVAQNISVTPAAYGNLTIAGGNTRTITSDVTVAGNLTISAGVLADAGNTLTVKGDVTNTATYSGTGQLVLAGGTVQHSIGGTGTFGNLTLNDANGSEVIGSFTVSGELKLTTGVFKLGNAFTTTFTGTVSRTNGFLAGNGLTSNLTVNGTGNVGTLFFETGKETIKTFVMNTNGEVSLGTKLNIETTLTMTSGLLKLYDNDLTIGKSATVTGAFNDTKMIVADATLGIGKLRKVFTDGLLTTFTFPIGEITGTPEYSPIVLTGFTATGADRTIGANVTDDMHPQKDLYTTQTDYVSRYWTFSDDGAGTGYTYTGITMNYFATDVVGTVNTTNDQVNIFDIGIGTWKTLAPAATINTTVATSTGAFNSTSNRLANTDFTVINNPLTFYMWTGATDNDWANATNWDPARNTPATADILQFSDGGTYTVTNIPDETIKKLLVTGGTKMTMQSASNTTLTINGSTGIPNVFVQSGAELEIGSGVNTMKLSYGTTAGQKADISGTLIINQSGSFVSTIANTDVNVASTGEIILKVNGVFDATNTVTTVSGAFTRSAASSSTITSTAGNLIFADGSFYNHATNSTGVIPVATYNNTSTVNITGLTSSAPSGLSGTFGNIVWNNTGQTTTTSINGAITVNGNLEVKSGIFYDNSFQITGNASGKLLMDAGTTLQLTNTGTNPFPTNFTTANISLDPASTVIYDANAAQNISEKPAYGNLTIAGGNTRTVSGNTDIAGNLTISSGTVADNGFTISVKGNVTNNATISGNGKILLTGGVAQHSIDGTGTFGNLELDDAQGALVANSFAVTGNLNLINGIFKLGNAFTTTMSGSFSRTNGFLSGNGTTSNLTVNGTGNFGTLYFETGNENLATLTVNRTGSGEFTLGTKLNIATSLVMTEGLIKLNTSDLTIGKAAAITGTFSNVNMIVADAAVGTGKLSKTFPSGVLTTFTFPVGETTGTIEYSPVTLTGFTAAGTDRTISVIVNDSKHPQMDLGTTQTNYLTRYWSFSDDAAGTGFTYTGMTLNYPAADEVGTINTTNDQICKYDNGTTTWAKLSTPATATSTAATVTGAFTNASGKLLNTDYTLRLTAGAAVVPVFKTQNLTLCAGETVTVGTHTYTSSGTYTDLLTAPSGADSTVTTVLKVKSVLTGSQTVSICADETYKVGASVYTASGTYTDVLKSPAGCDSTVTTVLTVKPITLTSQNVTICAGETFTVDSHAYTATGTYTDVLPSANGCKSIMTTTLTVRPPAEKTQNITVCNGETYTVGTNVYTKSGTYKDVFKAASGCDSTVTTVLNVKNAIDVETTIVDRTVTVKSTSGADYQWIDCNNSSSPISGEKGTSYLATANGSYAVVVTLGSCTQTSACANIKTIDVSNLSESSEIVLYPNPNEGNFTIKGESKTNLTIFNEIGQNIYSFELNDSNNFTENIENLASGVYFIIGTNQTGIVRKKVVVTSR